MPMNLKIISPEETEVDKSADHVRLMMESGAVGVLPGHSPFAGNVAASKIRFSSSGGDEEVYIQGGFAVVTPDSVTVFAAAGNK